MVKVKKKTDFSISKNDFYFETEEVLDLVRVPVFSKFILEYNSVIGHML